MMRTYYRYEGTRMGDDLFLGAAIAFPIVKWIMDKVTGKKQKEEKALRYQNMSADEQMEMDLIETEKGLKRAQLILGLALVVAVIFIIFFGLFGSFISGLYEGGTVVALAYIYYCRKQKEYNKVRK